MSVKRFCDICDKEITDDNKLPDPDEELTLNHTVPIVNCYDTKKLFIDIMISEGRSKDHSVDIDVCKNCVKEFVNQL
jgi:hypothetical protein